MRIDLTDILAREGKTEELETALEIGVFKTRAGEYPIIEKSPVRLCIAHNASQVLEITADCDVVIEVPCARCLEPVRTSFEIHAVREVDMKLTDEEREEMLDDGGYIEGKTLDVDALMHNEILFDWPMQVLCSEDCRGICMTCGANLNQTSCDCDTASLDPRMAAISDIFRKFKEV